MGFFFSNYCTDIATYNQNTEYKIDLIQGNETFSANFKNMFIQIIISQYENSSYLFRIEKFFNFNANLTFMH